MSELRNILIKDFADKECADAYVDEFLNTSIATQIKVIREQRVWTQKKLSSKTEMEQSRISLLENINNKMWSISTLNKIAKAFDVTLKVSFETFSNRIKDIDNFSRESLKRLPREDDLRSSTDTERASEASCNNVIPFPIDKLSRLDKVTLQIPPAQVGNGEIIKELYNG